jgi:hypothetical protein
MSIGLKFENTVTVHKYGTPHVEIYFAIPVMLAPTHVLVRCYSSYSVTTDKVFMYCDHIHL